MQGLVVVRREFGFYSKGIRKTFQALKEQVGDNMI